MHFSVGTLNIFKALLACATAAHTHRNIVDVLRNFIVFENAAQEKVEIGSQAILGIKIPEFGI